MFVEKDGLLQTKKEKLQMSVNKWVQEQRIFNSLVAYRDGVWG